MDWMQFVSALVSALAWPFAVVLLVCLLKNPILALIPKIRSLKYGDFHIDLSEALQSVPEELPATPTDPEAQPEAPSSVISVPLQIAAVSPRGGVFAAWLEVETALNDLIKRKDIGIDLRLPPRVRMEQLLKLGIVTSATYGSFMKISALRNEAAHMQELEISYEDAVAMAIICQRLVETLRKSE